MKKGSILIVDDEKSIVSSLEGILEDEGFQVMSAKDGQQALEIIRGQNPDLVLLDIWMPGMDGIEALQAIKSLRADLGVIVMSGHGSIDSAVKATKLGAFDYIEKPLSMDSLLLTVKHALEQQRLLRENVELKRRASKEENLVGENPRILTVRKRVAAAARRDDPVLILGENGTGKELVARLIHRESSRRDAPFVKLNCTNLAGEDWRQILWGTEGTAAKEGEFTRGKLVQAEGGTLFLDDVEGLEKEIEVTLAGFFESKSFPRAGGSESLPLDVRLMACTTKPWTRNDLAKHLSAEFLALFTSPSIQLPALRHRKEDIPALVNHFLRELAEEYGKGRKEVDKEAMQILMNYDWPGNVKELQNILERMFITVPWPRISREEIPAAIRKSPALVGNGSVWDGVQLLKDARRLWEQEFIGYNLRRNRGSLTKTAEDLGISTSSLERKMKTLKIFPPRPGEFQPQKSLKRSVVLCGQGLHSGLKGGLILNPLPPNSGIHFGNITSGESVPALIDYVYSAEYATSLKRGMAVARTIEHLMAVLHMYGVSNLLVKINDEVPIMDGSALDLCQLIEDGGIEEQGAEAEEIAVKDTITVGNPQNGGKYIRIEPAATLSVTYILDYPHPIGHQEFTFTASSVEDFKREIAPARTFGFLKDIAMLEQMGLGGGGRLHNVILVDEEKIINAPLRFPDEFVRHKILDVLGDLYLQGRRIRGKVTACMTGHSDNVELVRRIGVTHI
ncbi:MAG TPA: UDP-3-O-acyl-N-acetylglucosamine deacetylase [bacterium]|nr:UDP-3-O-acyl-N-acetylglucosamine deacetylase [bacterium]